MTKTKPRPRVFNLVIMAVAGQPEDLWVKVADSGIAFPAALMDAMPIVLSGKRRTPYLPVSRVLEYHLGELPNTRDEVVRSGRETLVKRLGEALQEFRTTGYPDVA